MSYKQIEVLHLGVQLLNEGAPVELMNYGVDVEFVKRVDVLIRSIEEQGCKTFHHNGPLFIGVAVYSLVSGEPRASLPIVVEVLTMSWCRELENILNQNDVTY